jgi:S-adenosylmethionine hydrolase
MNKNPKPDRARARPKPKCAPSDSHLSELQKTRHPARFITFTTDFGFADAYVGVMKGVVAGINPEAQVIDLCHDVPPQDVRAAAFLLAGSFAYFPPDTIHVAVVDPTVGGKRRALCVQAGRYFFIGPDNGVLSLACYRAGRPKIVPLENEKYFLEKRSRTFHGRDMFAPVAAHLSAGVPIESFGRSGRSMVRIRLPVPVVEDGRRIKGEIIHVDRFGNLITNIEEAGIRKVFQRADKRDLVIACASYRIHALSETYGDTSPGAAVALFGSYDLMEIAVRDGNASSSLGAKQGDSVSIELAEG